MAKGDVDFLQSNNTDCTIEDANGVKQRATLTAVTNNVDVFVQDQDSDPVIGKFNQPQAFTTVATQTAIDSRTVIVSDATDFTIGRYVIIYSPDDSRFYTGYITGATGTTLTVDTPLDFAFPVGSVAISSVTNMNVDGSTTAEIFGLRNPAEQLPFDVQFDVTRIIFHCLTEDPVTLATFGDLAELTNGLVLRKRFSDGSYKNIFNIKSNGELAGITIDWIPYAETNPVQGQNGFTARLTFNGQDKLGVVVRLRSGDDLELVVQDDLNTAQGAAQITLLECVAEGHVVVEDAQ